MGEERRVVVGCYVGTFWCYGVGMGTFLEIWGVMWCYVVLWGVMWVLFGVMGCFLVLWGVMGAETQDGRNLLCTGFAPWWADVRHV